MTLRQVSVSYLTIILALLYFSGVKTQINVDSKFLKHLTKDGEMSSKCTAIKTALDGASGFLSFSEIDNFPGSMNFIKFCFVKITSSSDKIPINEVTLNVAAKIDDTLTYFYEKVVNYTDIYDLYYNNIPVIFNNLLKIQKEISPNTLPKAMQDVNRGPSIFETMVLKIVKDYRKIISSSNFEFNDDTSKADILRETEHFLLFMCQKCYSESKMDISKIRKSHLKAIACKARNFLANNILDKNKNQVPFSISDDRISRSLGLIILLGNIELNEQSESLKNVYFIYEWSIFHLDSIQEFNTISSAREKIYDLAGLIYSHFKDVDKVKSTFSLENFESFLNNLSQKLETLNKDKNELEFLNNVIKNSNYLFRDITWLVLKFAENSIISVEDLERLKSLFSKLQSLLITITSGIYYSDSLKKDLDCIFQQLFE
ncbi:MAG: hypothetical protein MHPSP_000710, partial [Paramarteilia canceri]